VAAQKLADDVTRGVAIRTRTCTIIAEETILAITVDTRVTIIGRTACITHNEKLRNEKERAVRGSNIL
jgi:hypothetical protein